MRTLRRSNNDGDARANFANQFSGCARLLPILAALVLTVETRAAEPSWAVGITKPLYDVTISAPVPGIVMARKFAEGDFVKEGDVILELDKKLEELETERRKLVRDQKRSDFEGTQKLFSTTKGVSKEDVEKKELEYKVAAVEHDMAVEQLRRRHVAAPIAGAITKIHIEPGEACQPYQALARIVDARRCYFVTNVEAKSASLLKMGQAMKLELDTGSGPVATQGKITLISPVVDSASGLQEVKVIFDNAEGKVPSGVAGRMLLE